MISVDARFPIPVACVPMRLSIGVQASAAKAADTGSAPAATRVAKAAARRRVGRISLAHRHAERPIQAAAAAVDRSSSGDRPSVQERTGTLRAAGPGADTLPAASQDPPDSRRPTTLDRAFGTAAPPLCARSVDLGRDAPLGRLVAAARGLCVVPGDPRAAALAPRARHLVRRPARTGDEGPRPAARAARWLLGRVGRASGSGVSAISRRNVVGRRVAAVSWPPWPDLLVPRGGPPDRADGRFAPSPTGTLHLGNLRTAVLAWLFARAARRALPRPHRGSRRAAACASRSSPSSSTTSPRSDSTMTARSSASPRGPASTTPRTARLRDDGLVYRCWCTRAEIREAASAPHEGLPEGAYPGTCRDLPARRVAALEASGRPPALRVARRRRRRAVHRPAVRAGDRRRGRLRDPAQRRRVRLQPRRRRRRRRPARRRGRARRRPPRLHAAPALAAAAPRAPPGPATRTSRSSWAPAGERLSKRDGATTLAEARAAGRTPDQVRGDARRDRRPGTRRRGAGARGTRHAHARSAPLWGTRMSDTPPQTPRRARRRRQTPLQRFVRIWLPLIIIASGILLAAHPADGRLLRGRCAAGERGPVRLAAQRHLPHRRSR